MFLLKRSKLNPAFALVSMNMAPCSFALVPPSSVDNFLITSNEVMNHSASWPIHIEFSSFKKLHKV
jgi:hypothetical protein